MREHEAQDTKKNVQPSPLKKHTSKASIWSEPWRMDGWMNDWFGGHETILWLCSCPIANHCG
jgi:hypothetical protein